MDRYRYHGITDMRKASRRRLADARALLATQKPEHARAAGYLAGYAVECKLKSIAMEIYDCLTLRALADRWRIREQDVYTHGIEVFAKRMSGLWRRLDTSHIRADFKKVNEWRPSWRYDPAIWDTQKAAAFLNSARQVLNWLDSNRG